MGLEIILSQTEKDKYHHINYMWNLKKYIQMNIFPKSNRPIDIENKVMGKKKKNKVMVTKGKSEGRWEG